MTGGVGIFGGAFDPPHDGHVELAREAIAHFELSRLLVRVVADPGHKDVETAPQIRLLLAELAFAPVDEADVSLDPFARTVDSLEALGFVDPVFLIGADELAAFGEWSRPERVLELARHRSGDTAGNGSGRSSNASLQGSRAPDRVELFPITPLPISSTDIRDRVAGGRPIDDLVPAAVAAEIERLDLYRTP